MFYAFGAIKFSGFHAKYLTVVLLYLSAWKEIWPLLREAMNSPWVQVLSTVSAMVGLSPILIPFWKRLNLLTNRRSLPVRRERCFNRQDEIVGMGHLDAEYPQRYLPAHIFAIEGKPAELVSHLIATYPRWRSVELHIIEKFPNSQDIRELVRRKSRWWRFSQKSSSHTWKKIKYDREICFYKIPVVHAPIPLRCLLFDDIHRGGKTMLSIRTALYKMQSFGSVEYVSFCGECVPNEHLHLEPDFQIYPSATDVYFS